MATICFSAPDREINVAEITLQSQSLKLEHGLFGELFGLEDAAFKFAAGHVVGKLFVVQILGGAGDDQFAAAEDRKSLRNFKNFV